MRFSKDSSHHRILPQAHRYHARRRLSCTVMLVLYNDTRVLIAQFHGLLSTRLTFASPPDNDSVLINMMRWHCMCDKDDLFQKKERESLSIVEMTIFIQPYLSLWVSQKLRK